ncbi:phosphatidate cytidylyltransferase, partial [Myxococcota bacterium]|nr:phosphatidate cytidylyltransferase [Myxococcota bacterium]
GLCASELYGTFEEGGESPWKRSGILIGIGLILLAYRVPDAIGWIFPGVLLFYWILRWISGPDPSTGLVRLKRTLFGILYPFLCLAFFVDLGLREAGFGYVVLYYGLAEVNDSAAYLVGSTVGRHKIFPKLSPKKTVEGVVGGVLLTLCLAYALWFAVPEFSALKLGAAAVIIAAGGLAGDLFASRLKRRVGVKDYGEAVPTQGGVLDVYDAFIFVAPIFYYFLRLTGMSVEG